MQTIKNGRHDFSSQIGFVLVKISIGLVQNKWDLCVFNLNNVQIGLYLNRNATQTTNY